MNLFQFTLPCINKLHDDIANDDMHEVIRCIHMISRLFKMMVYNRIGNAGLI